MVNLVWTGIIKLADGNTAILQLALLCAGLLVVPRPTEWCHLLPFIITASSLFIILHQVIGLVSHEPQTLL